MIGLICLALVLGFIFAYGKIRNAQNYWAERGVKHRPPTFLFGDVVDIILRRKHVAYAIQDIYNAFPDTRYTGAYAGIKPMLLIRDPELIKQVTIKDFEHFVNRSIFLVKEEDPIWVNNIFALTNQKWKDMRIALTPAFTSNKVKRLFPLVDDCCKTFLGFFEAHPEECKLVNMKDVMSRFTNDVIASIAFGIQIDSLGSKNNEFYLMAKELTCLNAPKKTSTILAYAIVPKIAKCLGLNVFPSKLVKFFKNIVRDTIKQREALNLKRPDMIDILMEAKKGWSAQEGTANLVNGVATVNGSKVAKGDQKHLQIDDDYIAAQAIGFFFAGVETVSTVLCYMVYELSLNEPIQRRLQQEIDDFTKKNPQGLSFEGLASMPYMDMVLSETMRMWPPLGELNRVCTKPYVIQPTSEEERPVHLEVGSMIWFSVFGLHRDPKHFPDPERFDPERFSPENKANIKACAYQPFGVGPRSCIATRFALIEMKTLMYHLLSKFDLVMAKKTQVPVKFNKKSLFAEADGGIWIEFRPRSKP